jgi:N utilization substance protein B
MKRRRAREFALQILFQLDVTNSEHNDELFEDFWESISEDDDVKEFTHDIVVGTGKHLDAIDKVIREKAENWTIERMPIVDRSILRASVYEIMYRKDIPRTVIINEAIEIAKKYSTEDSASFINGILDKIHASNSKFSKTQ